VQNLAEFVQVAVRKLQPSLTVDKAIEWVDAFTQMYAVINLTPQIVLEAAREYATTAWPITTLKSGRLRG
jgi:predicted nucleic acid-binding protein